MRATQMELRRAHAYNMEEWDYDKNSKVFNDLLIMPPEKLQEENLKMTNAFQASLKQRTH